MFGPVPILNHAAISVKNPNAQTIELQNANLIVTRQC